MVHLRTNVLCAGVPQGSVFGSFFALILTTKQSCIDLNYHLFPDDTTMYTDDLSVHNRLQDDINQLLFVRTVIVKFELFVFNANKSVCLILHSKRKVITDSFQIQYGDGKIALHKNAQLTWPTI